MIRPREIRVTGVTAFALLFALLLLSACASLKYDITPTKDDVYHTVTLRVNVKQNSTGKRQNFKVLLKFDERNDKMLFLSPLNQVYGQLFIEDEKALLVNTKNKRYWRGTFRLLINELWALDFNYREFKKLIMEGEIPQDKVKQQNLDINLEPDKKTGKTGRVRIEYNDMLVKLKIYNHKTGQGKVNFTPEIKNMSRDFLRTVLESK